MYSLPFLGVITVIILVYLQAEALAYPQPEEEDYASYATLYPEIAKKIGEEPIEIIDVIKAVLVYDSDDTTPSSQTGEPDTEVINSTDGQAETFQRITSKQA